MHNSGPKIYCVDDEPLFTDALARILRKTIDARVTRFHDGEKAVSAVVQDPPDLLITDLFQPGIGGFEIIRRLRANVRTRSLWIWVISGSIRRFLFEAWEAGADVMLAKPPQLDELRLLLGRLFRRPAMPFSSLDLDVEAPWLDFKERPNLETAAARAELARDVIAMANRGGGEIIFGREELADGRFGYRGLTAAELAQLEVTRLNKAIADFIDPPHHVTPRVEERDGRSFVIVTVPSMGEVPLLAARQHEGASLYRGRLYTRTASAESAPAATSAEVQGILDRAFRARARDRGVK